MESVTAFRKAKILNQCPIGQHGLRTNSGPAVFKVLLPQFWDQALQSAAKQTSTKGTRDFVPNHFLVLTHELPQSWEGKGIRQITQIYAPLGITLTGKRKNRIRTGLNPTTNETGKMNT